MAELKHTRLMGLDYGARTVGVAVSNAERTEATPLATIRRERENHLRRTFARIEELVSEHGVSGFVVGEPLHMDGSESERSKASRAFGEQLSRRTGLPVTYMDERLTSVEADTLMKEAGMSNEERRQRIDAVAARIILQDYLDHTKQNGKDHI